MSNLSYVKQNYVQYINHIISNNKVSHAYLIELDNYEEDFKFVLSFIKMILCNLSYDDLNHSDNQIIHLIDTNQYPDLYYILSDTSVINKSLIKNLQKEFNNKSLLDNKKIYVIKEAEKMNLASANTILKFLEEPEENIIAILLTNDRYHVIDTILSRCQVLSLKENSISFDYDDNFLDILDCVLHPENYFVNYNSVIKDLFNDKGVFVKYLELIEITFIYYLSNNYKSLNNFDYQSIFKDMDHNKIISILSIMEEEIPKLNFNVNVKLWLDSFFSRLIGG